LLGDLDATEIHRLRTVLAQMVLRLGFDLAGRQLPADLRGAATEMMQREKRLDALEQSLNDLLADSVEKASPAPRETETKKIFALISGVTPKALAVMEAFLEQWDRMERMEVQLKSLDDQPVLAATIKVLPDKQVRLADVLMFQPTVVFRGESRIAVIPDAPGTGETLVLFEPVDDGAVELRFEGVVYGLARLLAFPLADGALREVRVFTHTPKQGYRIVNLAMLSEAAGEIEDPRRLLVFQDVRRNRIARKAFSLEVVEEQSEQVFNYFTPDRHYTYKRSKRPAEE
ncbi:MAG: hypothetical protein ACYSTL_03710, partial [Planctomycetota bacterium]